MAIYLFSQILKFAKYSIKLIEKLSKRHLINSSDVFVIKGFTVKNILTREPADNEGQFKNLINNNTRLLGRFVPPFPIHNFSFQLLLWKIINVDIFSGQHFLSLTVHKPPLGSCELPQKYLAWSVQPVYWTQTDSETENRQLPIL